MEAPGRVRENTTTTIMIINRNGTKILDILPKPSSKCLWDINQISIQTMRIAIHIKGTKCKMPVRLVVD